MDANRKGYGAVWELDLNSFRGIVAGASHWFAKLSGRTEDVTVQARVDAALSRSLSTRDYTYRVGTTSERFASEADARAAAVAVFRTMAGDRDVLVEKYADPGVLLAGPDDLLAEGARCAGDDDTWWDWKGRFAEHLHPTVIGYKAPPSPRSYHEVTVQRDGDAWIVEAQRQHADRHGRDMTFDEASNASMGPPLVLTTLDFDQP
jgi:hypothetical protein